MTRYTLTWNELTALEPTPDELAAHAAALSRGYNDPRNAELMGHTADISPAEVIESYAESIASGMRAFLLFSDGALAGDADLRGIREPAADADHRGIREPAADVRGIRETAVDSHIDRNRTAEFAFMIAAPTAQGKGLGTRFALMVHAFGFRSLELTCIYASVVPHNTASRRVFEKLGYVVDDSPAARAYADEPTDIVLALDRQTFETLHAGALAEIQIAIR